MAQTAFHRDLATQLRVDSVRCSSEAGSGHPTSGMSAADLMAVLLDQYLHLDFSDPDNPHNDHLIFSKGHASPLYYAMLKAAGAIDDEEFMTYRRLNSRLEGHPTPRIPPTDVATGSLGQGLPVATGMALAGRDLDALPYRTWVLCGDSEMSEGSMWEAFAHASWRELDNLTAIVDVNRLGQTRETMLGWDMNTYADRARAFGWHAIVIDGHDLEAIDRALHEAVTTQGRPTVILAQTHKGRGVAAVEDKLGKHGKPVDDADAAIAELGGNNEVRVQVTPPRTDNARQRFHPQGTRTAPRWDLGEEVATRAAYGTALTALGDARGDVTALDGEVSNSTHSQEFAQAHPDRYFEMFIAEQQMIAAANGMQARGWVPYCSTFAAFFTRAYDFVRMAAVSRADLRLAGSHAGVSIGEDGPSQMGLEDIAALRAVHGSTVLHPSDANQSARLTEQMADHSGISYLRTLRGKTPVRTPPDEQVSIGGSRTVRSSENDTVTLIGCGITVGECVRAAELLESDGVAARVLDCYSLKPIDSESLRQAAHDTHALVTVEDHWPEGGLGDAVLAALATGPDRPPVAKLAVTEMPVSGKPAELMEAAGLDAETIRRTALASGR